MLQNDYIQLSGSASYIRAPRRSWEKLRMNKEQRSQGPSSEASPVDLISSSTQHCLVS